MSLRHALDILLYVNIYLIVSLIIIVRTHHFCRGSNVVSLSLDYFFPKKFHSWKWKIIIFYCDTMRWWWSVQASTLYAEIEKKYDYKNFIFLYFNIALLSRSIFQHSISQYFSQFIWFVDDKSKKIIILKILFR